MVEEEILRTNGPTVYVSEDLLLDSLPVPSTVEETRSIVIIRYRDIEIEFEPKDSDTVIAALLSNLREEY